MIQKADIEGLCRWIRKEKGITEIGVTDLVDYLSEYEKWLNATKKEICPICEDKGTFYKNTKKGRALIFCDCEATPS